MYEHKMCPKYTSHQVSAYNTSKNTPYIMYDSKTHPKYTSLHVWKCKPSQIHLTQCLSTHHIPNIPHISPEQKPHHIMSEHTKNTKHTSQHVWPHNTSKIYLRILSEHKTSKIHLISCVSTQHINNTPHIMAYFVGGWFFGRRFVSFF